LTLVLEVVPQRVGQFEVADRLLLVELVQQAVLPVLHGGLDQW
jgi:hypothetical protein